MTFWDLLATSSMTLYNKIKLMEINQKKLETIIQKGLKKEREEFQRYLGVIAEDFKSQVQLVAESISDINRRLAAIEEMVAKNTEDIEVIKMRLTAIENDIAAMKQNARHKVNIEEFENLERRVMFLEKKLNYIKT